MRVGARAEEVALGRAERRGALFVAWRADVSTVWHVGVLPLLAIACAAALFGIEPALADGAVVDREQTLDGLRARIGDDIDRWRVDIEEESGTVVAVRVSGDDGASKERSLELRGETTEERSRELATALAFLIDELEAEDTPADGEGSSQGSSTGEVPEPVEPAPSPKEPIRGWLSLGPRLGVGRPASLDYDVGGDLFGGVELLGGHLQPLFVFGVTGASRAELELVYVHLGAGLAGGTGLLQDRLWVGGGVVPRAMWLRLQEGERSSNAWNGAASVLGIGHYRMPLKGRIELQVSLRVGADVTLPPLILTGSSARLARGEVRALMAGSVGLRW